MQPEPIMNDPYFMTNNFEYTVSICLLVELSPGLSFVGVGF